MNIFKQEIRKDWHFQIYHGPALTTLEDLLHFLPKMTADQFVHHVNEHKNDFVQWIVDMHGPGTMTKEVAQATTKEALLEVLQRKWKEYEQQGNTPTPEKTEEPVKEAPKPTPEERKEGTPKEQAQVEEKKTTQSQEKSTEKDALPEEERYETEEKKDKPKPIMDDNAFAQLRDEYTEKDEQMSEKFDAITQKIEDTLADPIPEELVELEDSIKTRYTETRQRLSEIRRSGKDTLIAALILKNVVPKLALAHVTREKQDFALVTDLLDRASQELDEAEKQVEINVKEEVYKQAGIRGE